MKKTKVLVPALGILTLSMAASITGTVAWFSANATVTASGMRIAAATDSSLLITDDREAEWGYEMTFAEFEKATVMPVSPLVYSGASHCAGYASAQTDGVTDIHFYQKGAKNAVGATNNHEANYTFDSFAAEEIIQESDATYERDSASGWSATQSNYAYDDIFLRLAAVKNEQKLVDMTITVTSALEGGKAIDKALHVGFWVVRDQALGEDYPVDMGGKIDADADADSKGDTFRHYDLTSFSKSGSVYSKTYDSWIKLTSYKDVKISTYAWYEGEDTDCTSDNANIVNELSIEIGFNLAE